MGKNVEDYRQLLKSGRWFAELPEDVAHGLLDAGRLKNLALGQRLFSRGDEPAGLHAVVAGSIRISATGPDGKEILLILMEPPAWFGEISLFDRLPMTHDATAETDTCLVEVPISAIDAMVARDPRTWRHLGSLMATKMRLAFVAMEDRALLPNLVRMARRLVWMAVGYGELRDHSRRVAKVKQEQLALMLSVSRQTANQLIKELEAQGLIAAEYGEIEIVDLDGLKQVAGLE